MQFQVPQFIETEDKVVGPFSIRQFAYVGAACLITAIFYFLVSTWLAIIVGIIFIGGALALSFLKVEGRPLITIVISAINFYWKPQTYVWQPEEAPRQKLAPSLKASSVFPSMSHTPASQPAANHTAASSSSTSFSGASTATKSAKPQASETGSNGKSFEDMLAGVLARKWETVRNESSQTTAESIANGSSLHKSWQNMQTGEISKTSDRQFVERKMNERYQILQKITGERTAAKRVDYR